MQSRFRLIVQIDLKIKHSVALGVARVGIDSARGVLPHFGHIRHLFLHYLGVDI